MCGRYAAKKDPATLAAEFEAVDATGQEEFRPDFNVAPTRTVLTVVQRHPRDEQGVPDPERTERSIRAMKWGLVPNWAKDPSVGSRMINTRAESAAEKPAFRSSLKRKRCLMPAEGWYEWKREGKTKIPFFMTRTDGESLAMAALWATWRPKDAADDEPPLVTCSVITTEAVGAMADVHDRMPLLLPRSAWAGWLDPDREDVAELLVPPPPELVDLVELRPVSDQVNNVRNNGPQLMERVEPEPPLQETLL
ncbi:MAG TPA: SOS response-associated peptidase [Pseudonocardiaceae bacterium]